MLLRIWTLFCLAALPLPALAEEPLDFSGTWVADGDVPSASGKASADDSTAHSAHGMGGHGGGRGGMGGGMGGGQHGRHSSNSAASTDTDASRPAIPRLHANTLIIRQSEVVFDIAADGQRSAYRFDNRNNYGTQFGGTVMLTWSSPEMVIETHPDAGGSVEEHFTLAPDGKRLQLVIRMQRAGTDGAREVKRVFVRDDAGAPAGDQPALP